MNDKPDSRENTTEELSQRMIGLSNEVRRLREYLENLRLDQYIRALLSNRRIAFYGFLSGILSGLGTVLGATLGIALLLYILSRLEVVPFIGRFVSEIVNIVQQQQHPKQ